MFIPKSKLEQQADIADEELMRQVSDGGIDAFDIIVARYRDRLLNFVFRFLGDRETAEDIVQETFLRVYKNRKEYKVLASFSTWIFTIAGNLAKSELGRRKRWRFTSIDWDDQNERRVELPDESWQPDELAETSIANDLIQRAIDSLPVKYRQVVILRDVEGMSYQEISKIVKVPVGTVKSRVNRGRLKLQARLKRLWKEVPSSREQK